MMQHPQQPGETSFVKPTAPAAPVANVAQQENKQQQQQQQVHLLPPPMVQPLGVEEFNRHNYWQTDICTCPGNGECTSVCLSFVFPCYIFAQNVQLRDGGYGAPFSWGMCCAHFALCSGGACSLLQFDHRTRTRRAYGIKGSWVSDVAMSFLCTPCALAQENREIKRREMMKLTSASSPQHQLMQ